MTGQGELNSQEGSLEQDSFLQKLEDTVPFWRRNRQKPQQQREGYKGQLRRREWG